MSDQAMPPEMMWQTIKDLRAEVDRLRAALEKIAEVPSRYVRRVSDAIDIAREALENKNG